MGGEGRGGDLFVVVAIAVAVAGRCMGGGGFFFWGGGEGLDAGDGGFVVDREGGFLGRDKGMRGGFGGELGRGGWVCLFV